VNFAALAEHDGVDLRDRACERVAKLGRDLGGRGFDHGHSRQGGGCKVPRDGPSVVAATWTDSERVGGIALANRGRDSGSRGGNSIRSRAPANTRNPSRLLCSDRRRDLS
jgi:hypothetical protein